MRLGVLTRVFTAILLSVGGATVLSCGPSQTPEPDIIVQCYSPGDCPQGGVAECLKAACSEGQCVIVADPAAQGEPCGVSDLCVATAGACDNGVCDGTGPVICPQVRCMVGSCDSSDGSCVYEPAVDGVVCEGDENECTDDSCVSGRCEVGSNHCPCDTVGDCPDLDSLCGGIYVCDSNRCVIDPATAVVCPAAGQCEQFECDPATGACVRQVTPDGTLCDQSDVCSARAVCLGGVCEKEPRCDDDNQCTDDLCNPETGACSYPARSGDCDDGNLCTGPDTCSGGRCGGPALFCADLTECTLDECDPETGCANVPVLAGTPCTEGDLCIVDKTCSGGGVCLGSRPKCDDDNLCTSDSCNSLTGECSHSFVGGACDDENPCTTDESCTGGVCTGGIDVPGCCNFDADCEDLDLCTTSRCSDSVCIQEGQPPDLCPVDAGCGESCCAESWCMAQSGECAAADMGFPLLMAAWDFASGGVLRGFFWGEPAGHLTATGAAVKEPATQAVIRLPGRAVPDGTVILYAELASGACADITFGRASEARGCGVAGGRQMVAAAFTSTQVVDGQGRLDLSVIIGGSAVVARMNLYLWNREGCAAGGVLMSDSSSATDLAVDASLDGVAVIFRDGASMKSAVIGVGGQITAGQFSPTDFSIVPGRFSTSLVSVADGARVAAWGGADNRIRMAGLGSGGEPGTSVLLPIVDLETEIQAWPSLAVGPVGRTVMAFAYGVVTDFDIGMVVLDKDLGVVGSASRVNDSTDGTRSKPVVDFDGDTGIFSWLSETSGGLRQYLVSVRKAHNQGTPTGLEVSLGVQDSQLPKGLCIDSATQFFCLWQKSNGSLSGAVLDHDTLGIAASFDIGGVGDVRSQPLLLPSDGGVVIVSVQGSGATAKVVAQTVMVDGAVSPAITIASPVLASSVSISASRFGPFMYVLAWTDLLGAAPGVRIQPFCPLCAAGFINLGAVCAGFGNDGYVGGVSK